MRLSNHRVDSTITYLISKAVKENRMGQGYGESEPKVACGVGCTEEEHALPGDQIYDY
jgi:outer membrane protein OmpA-like peptidoglycan-associated protein